MITIKTIIKVNAENKSVTIIGKSGTGYEIEKLNQVDGINVSIFLSNEEIESLIKYYNKTKDMKFQ